MTADFAVHTESHNGAVIARVDGEIDLSSAQGLARQLEDARDGQTLLVVDLRAVVYLDSAGLAVLDTSAREMAALGGSLRLVVDEASVVFRALEISGLSATIPTFQTLDTAIDAGPA